MAGVAILTAQQAAGAGTVTGVVIRGGNPVQGIPVQVKSAVSSYSAKTTTDQKGNFSFANVPVGGVTLSALNPDGQELGSNSGILQQPNQSIAVTVLIH